MKQRTVGALRERAGSASRSAQDRAEAEIQERADADAVKAAARETLRALEADEGAPDGDYGTTGTETDSIAKRATDAAKVRSPMGGSLRTIGDERVVTDMARAAAAEGDGLATGAGLTFEGEASDRPERAASDPAFVGVSAGFGMEGGDDPVAGEGLSVADPFGLTGTADNRDDGGDDDPFPGVRLFGGEE
ncbi:hypothetical protein DU484_18365 [Haloplanus rubicundus]|uniref:Uncharacterized protein n=1 Tax=Haloplanus rubicundus TaxID=1547898 RepID=A0A345EHI9_9EURY|nr:hypothetical protein DU484_18365 [Haloplanus rubicundus]